MVLKNLYTAAKSMGFIVTLDALRALANRNSPLRSLLSMLLVVSASANSLAAPKTFLGNDDYPPLLFPVDGQPTGLYVDLAEAIFRAGQLDYTIELDEWAEAQNRAQSGDVDGLLNINQSPARLEIFDFSEPVLESEFALFIASENYDIAKLGDLKQRRVGSEAKGYARVILERDPDITIVTIDDWVAGFEMIQQGELDAILIEKWVGEYLLSTNQILGIKVSPYPIEPSTTHIAVAKDDTELLNAINYGIATIRSDGTYDAILDRWRGETVVYITESALATQRIIDTLAIAFGITCVLLLLLMTKVIRQKRKLDAKSIDLEQLVADRTADLTASLENAEVLELALNSTQIAMYSIDPSSDQIVNANAAANLLVTGCADKNIIGRSPFDFNADHAETTEFKEALLQSNGESITRLIKFNVDNGDKLIVELTAVVRVVDSFPLVYAFAVDRTEKVRAEVELRDALKELQERRDKQALMLSVISHELRTPLSASAMIYDQLNDNNLDSYLPVLKANSESILSIMDDLRLVIRPDDAHNKEETIDSPALVIEQTLGTLSNLAEQHKVTVHLSFDALSSEMWRFNTSALRQIVTNLTKNVFLHAEASNVWVSASATQSDTASTQLTVCVEDDGKGISEAFQQTMYEAFSRGETSGEGKGLGLYIINELAKLLNGEIAYFSSARGGAGFNLTAHLVTVRGREDTKEPTYSEEQLNQTLWGKTVLFAEDQLTIQVLTKALLTKEGAEVSIASNGKLALAAFSEAIPDIVLTDAMMPEIDGYELSARLREAGYVGPIIAVTAATIGDERDRLLAAGADVVLPKPINMNKLKLALADWEQA